MAKGVVVGTNPPENKGTVRANVNGVDQDFVYNIKAGHTIGGYVPKTGHRVDFIADETNKVATSVKRDDPKPPACFLEAIPNTISSAGADVILHYVTAPDAVRANIQPMPGEVPVGDAEVTVRVDIETTFTLTVKNNDGSTDTSSVIVYYQP